MENVYFKEVQKFRQPWLWIIMALTVLVTVGPFLTAVVAKPGLLLDIGFLITCFFTLLIVLGVIALLLVCKLTTEIGRDGIDYRFFPFHLTGRRIEWKDVEKGYVRKYRPVTEYGGWGIRIGIWRHGRAYNVSGDVGLQLELKNGKKILFGTQRPEELDNALAQLAHSQLRKDQSG